MIIPSYPQAGFPVDANWGRQVIDAIRSLRLVAGRGLRKVSDGPNGQVLEATAQSSTQTTSDFDLSKFCFGFSISGATVTITAGEVQWGTSVFGIGTTDMIITEDLQYIGLDADFTSAHLIGPDSNLATFRSTPDIIRTWLYQFNWAASSTPGGTPTVSLRRIGKPIGNWIIGSEFSPQ